ncbi:phosphoribosyltransferase family protein [Nocardia sp. NPDC051787]|uniref:orotate phosphoribosyltransferase n=1 Tax=Nocardia sp. NPDC051787 TaxID=3155415 RepID=UPI00341724E3
MVPAKLTARIRAAAIRHGQFKLPSGEVLEEYFDQYALAADPLLLRDTANALARELPGRTESIIGIALGGVPLAVALSAVTGVRAGFYRPVPKPYGTFRQIEADIVSGNRVVLIDDVVRSGAQILRAADVLSETGASVVGVVCLLDRELGGRERLARRGIELRPLLTPSTLYGIEPKRDAS